MLRFCLSMVFVRMQAAAQIENVLMKNKDKLAWWDRNERVNQLRELALGLEVVDAEGHRGVVVKIVQDQEDDHGCVYVWQQDKVGYGSDNCEHTATIIGGEC